MTMEGSRRRSHKSLSSMSKIDSCTIVPMEDRSTNSLVDVKKVHSILFSSRVDIRDLSISPHSDTATTTEDESVASE